MLQPYRYYAPHPFEDLHGFIVEAMNRICTAGPGDSFDESVLKKLPLPFKNLILEEAKNSTDYLYKPLSDLFDLITGEPEDQRALLHKAIELNNEVEQIAGCVNARLILYEEIKNKALADSLKIFLNNLYDKYLNRGAFINYATRRGMEFNFPKGTPVNFLQHFRGLMKANEVDVCPFCGIFPLSNEFNIGRNAYDHFLPKGIVPFVSVNFRNLAPMCDECNSKHKRARVPVYLKEGAVNKRVRAFYPYATKKPQIEIGFKLKNKEKNWDEWLPEDIEMEITSHFTEEEAQSWREVFGIDVRYKALVLGPIRKNLMSWLLKTYEMYKIQFENITWEQFIGITMKIYQNNLLMDQYFLKYALLKCLVEEANLLKRLEDLAPEGRHQIP